MSLLMYKYRLYPSRIQQKRILNQFKICKEIYNTLLDLNKNLLVSRKFDFNSLVQDIGLTQPEYFSQAHSQVLQNVSDRLSKSFDSFFRRVKERKHGKKIKVGYPRFKHRIQSMTYPQSGFKFVSSKRLYASKIGNIPVILHRIPKGKIKTLTIKVNKANRWFAVFSSEMPESNAVHPSKEKVGIDVGLENFATLSNGERIENPRFLVKGEEKIKVLQRRVSRKKKCSSNRRKAVRRLAVQHIKVANQRSDWLHKLSRSLTLRYGKIAIEELQIKNMVKNHHLAKSISDASWGAFINVLSYKEVILGGQIFKSLRTRGSSHRCSKCGHYVRDMPLSKRTFKCPECFVVLHRDHNAALNHVKDTVGMDYAKPNACGDSASTTDSSVASGIVESGTIIGSTSS